MSLFTYVGASACGCNLTRPPPLVDPSTGLPVYCGPDKILIRSAREFSGSYLELLNEHSKDAFPADEDEHPPIRNGRHSDKQLAYVVVCPDNVALASLAKKPKTALTEAELTREGIMASWQESRRCRDLYDRHYVQLYHGKKHVKQSGGTTYTGRESSAKIFVWYADRLSKRTGEPCFRFEARLKGVDALERLGIRSPADLITFDYHGFFERHYRQLFKEDVRLIARHYDNVRAGRRRQKERIVMCGNLSYSIDRAEGAPKFRANACLNWDSAVELPDDKKPDTDREPLSVQQWVDRFGRVGLRPLTRYI